MKRVVNLTHLSDIIDRISYFVVFDDCSNYEFSKIYSSSEIDDDDSEFISSLPNEELLSLDSEDLHSIVDEDILDRLAKLDISKLSSQQKKILRKAYKKSAIISEEDKIKLLQMFKKCNKIIKSDRKKNNTFLAEYNISDADILDILHKLKLSDFDKYTRSINYGHFGNSLIVFHPNILIPCEEQENNSEIMVGANLYVKLDVDESTHECVAVISIHPRKYD